MSFMLTIIGKAIQTLGHLRQFNMKSRTFIYFRSGTYFTIVLVKYLRSII